MLADARPLLGHDHKRSCSTDGVQSRGSDHSVKEEAPDANHFPILAAPGLT